MRKDPVTREVSRTFQDINGIKHSSYADAYKASVHIKLANIVRISIADHRNAAQIADAIMNEMVVAWG